MTLVDVILPTRGRAHTIGYSIRSVLDQTMPDFRLEIVGDGCDEATETRVRSINDPRLGFSRFPKGMGFGYANRNAVLRRGTAPFVAYMTDDDLLFPDHLEKALAILSKGGAGLVAFRAAQVRYPDALDPCFFAFDWKLGAASRFLRNWFIGSGNLVHRRDLFDRLGYWNETLFRFGDREFFQRARSAGEAVFVDETTLLRFFAAQWDARYAEFPAPPQEKYAALLRDPEWRRSLREKAAPGRRSPSVRAGQARDFLRFAMRSGPRFFRYAAHRAIRGA